MTKSQLAVALARRTGISIQRASFVLDTFLEQVTDALMRGERVEIRNFGNFTVRYYPGYTGRNPKTGESVRVKAKRLPFFKPGLGLKRRLNPGSKFTR